MSPVVVWIVIIEDFAVYYTFLKYDDIFYIKATIYKNNLDIKYRFFTDIFTRF